MGFFRPSLKIYKKSYRVITSIQYIQGEIVKVKLEKLKECFNKIRHWERKRKMPIGAFVAVFDKKSFNRMALVKHGYGQKKRSLPGGGSAYTGEPLPKIATREAKQEIGLDVAVGIYGLKAFINFKSQEGAVALFEATIIGGDGIPENPNEISEWGFFSEGEIDEMWRREEIYRAQYCLAKIAFKRWTHTIYEWPESLRSI